MLMVLVFGSTIAYGLSAQRRQRGALSATKPSGVSGTKHAKVVAAGTVVGEDTMSARSQRHQGGAPPRAIVSAQLTPPFASGGYLPEPIARGILPPPAPTLRDVVLRDVQERGGLAPSPQPNYGESDDADPV